MKEGIKKGIVVLGVLALLVAAYWWGGNSPLLHGWSPEPKKTQQTVSSSFEQSEQQNKMEIQQKQQSAHETGEEQRTENNPISVPAAAETILPSPPSGGMTSEEKMQAAAELAQSSGVEVKGQFDEGAAEGKPKPVDQEQQVISDTQGYCTLSVTCESLLTHMDWLPEEKRGLVPTDGVIFPATQVIFYEGENVFHVLRRELKKAGIHMEFTNTPVFRSAYIEGIQNLYEFDCGELSGWMYSVNGWFPNYGCSRYQIQNGDVIRWIYTCELGVDIGGYNDMY